MQALSKIIACYDAAAENYAAQFKDELSKKHLDRLLLRAFADANKSRGTLADFGCGPGHTSRFLARAGMPSVLGVDISPQMILTANRLFPDLRFDCADFLNLPYKPDSFGSAIAFYGIVNLDYTQVERAFLEIARVLKPGGQFLFSYHVGTEVRHVDRFLDTDADIDFYFFETERILALLKQSGFSVIDALERHPYPDVE